MMPMTESSTMKGKKAWLAWGSSGSTKRTYPLVPIFRRMPARMTLPAVGVRQPGVEGEHGDLDGEPDEEGEEDPHLQLHRDLGSHGVELGDVEAELARPRLAVEE